MSLSVVARIFCGFWYREHSRSGGRQEVSSTFRMYENKRSFIEEGSPHNQSLPRLMCVLHHLAQIVPVH